MVYLKRSSSDAVTTSFPAAAEAEEEKEIGHLSKRSKLINTVDDVPSQYNPLDEPSPLGLRLRKSPSLLDLIDMRLKQANKTKTLATNPVETAKPRENKASVSKEKLKASNFPATLLRIGDWEFVSTFDGDLVAKCYFAKHKLVWEILENGLKSKIEIQWPDITALKVNFPEDAPGTLSITLAKPPHFFKEADPQPRKHTIWQASADFTGGKASRFRQHTLICPAGVLNKHYEKLIQCDEHLKFLSKQQSDIVANQSPCFEERVRFLKNPTAAREVDSIAKRSPTVSYALSSPSSSSFNLDEQSSAGLTPESFSLEALSPSSVMLSSSQGDGYHHQENSEELNTLGLKKSMSVHDLIDHIEHCITDFSPSSRESTEGQDALKSIAQFLFTDTNLPTTSDEQKLMSRVNSLCCLIQDPENENQSKGLKQNENQFKGLMEHESQSKGLKQNEYQFKGLKQNENQFKGLKVNENQFKGLMETENQFKGLKQNEYQFKGLMENENQSKGLKQNDNQSKGLKQNDNQFKGLMENENPFKGLKQNENQFKGLKQNENQFKGLMENEKQTMGGMPRKDSYSDLLLNLPRIASLPDFLFDISEGDENQAK